MAYLEILYKCVNFKTFLGIDYGGINQYTQESTKSCAHAEATV